MTAALVGSQAPRVALAPRFEWSAADDAAFLGESYGLKPDPWQFAVIESWLAEDRAGKLVSGKCGVSVPRQNGKNGTIELVQLYKMVVQGRRILHTAHEVKTARKHFTRMLGFFDNERKYPELLALVQDIRRTNGQEAITLTNGASLEFIARSKGSGRGYTVDDLFFDEAQELTDEQLEALLPTISSAPSGDPQQIYAGTPPGPNASGEVFARLRAEGVAGKARRLSWHEWSIPDDAKPEDAVRRWRENAYATNPALGIRLNVTTVQDEVGAMSAEGFCRERLGKWDRVSVAGPAISFSAWSALRVERDEVPVEGRKVFAVNFAWDGSGVALAAAIRPGEGPIHVDPIKQAPMGEGTVWLADWLIERWRDASQIVIYGKGQAESLINMLREGGVRNRRVILTPTFSDAVAAHAMLEQAIKNGTLSHLALDGLNDQVRDAVKQPIGKQGGFGWASGSGSSVIMLNAVTFAHWGAQTTKRNASKRVEVGV